VSAGEPSAEYGSISAYYYSPAMNCTFMAMLIGLGALLYLYKGFSTEENWALNVAGAAVIVVACVPTSPPGATETPLHAVVHGTAAIVVFLGLAICCWRCAPETLDFVQDPRMKAALLRAYQGLGIAMGVVPLVAIGLAFATGRANRWLFTAETAAVWTFAAFWLLKSAEMKLSSAEGMALAGTQSRYDELQSALKSTG
jgi:hypothetical protein